MNFPRYWNQTRLAMRHTLMDIADISKPGDVIIDTNPENAFPVIIVRELGCLPGVILEQYRIGELY